MSLKQPIFWTWLLIWACFLTAIVVSAWALSPRVEYEELIDIEEEVTDDK